MGNIISLVQNENMKIYRQISTWAMIGIFIFTLIAISSTSLFIVDSKMNEQETKKMISDFNQLPDDQKKGLESNIGILKVCLDKKINYGRVIFFIGFIFEFLSKPLITVFTIIIASNIIGKEFSEGAIKLLLIRPHSRTSILLSKYISVVLFGLLLLVLHCILSTGLISILFSPSLLPYMDIITKYGYDAVHIIIYFTMAFMISTVFRNQALAIGLTLFSSFAGSVFINLLSRHFSWIKYVLFANIDLSRYKDPIMPNEIGYQGMTFAFSVKILIVYYLIFMLLTWYSFNKRDVAI